MTRFLYVVIILLIGFGLAYRFAALEIFGLLVPKDAGTRQLAGNVSYGPLPRQQLDIYAPENAAPNLPVVVFVHGGSWNSGNKAPYEFAGRALAAKGFVAMVIDYRLRDEAPFPGFVEDTALALDWVSKHASEYGGDPRRIFAMGHSAGAYNAALAVLDKHYLAALGNDGRAIKGVISLAGPFDFLPLDGSVTIATFGKAADLASTQPVNFARADAPPFLLLHGSADTTCYPRNSINLDRVLRAAGAPSTLKIYEGVSHVGIVMALSRPFRAKAPTLDDAASFMQALLN